MRLVLGLELLAVIWALFVNTSQFFVLLRNSAATGQVIPLQIATILLLLASGIWILLTLLGAVSKKDWVRSSNLTIQVLVLAAATGILQGIIATKSVGFTLLVAAIIGILASIMIAGASRQKEQSRL